MVLDLNFYEQKKKLKRIVILFEGESNNESETLIFSKNALKRDSISLTPIVDLFSIIFYVVHN